MHFVDLVDAYGRSIHPKAPPVAVAHPLYGKLGDCVGGKGFVPEKNRWASTRALLRDDHRAVIKALRRFEDTFIGMGSKLQRWLEKNPWGTPIALHVINTYDNIVAARGNGALQDIWMAMTANQTPVTLSWYDLMSFANWSHATAPSISAYTSAGTGGAVSDATSNGSWLTNPQSTNHKYIVSMGLTATSISGFALAMLYDQLWAGQYVITSNATINPTTDVAVTRYASTTPGNADYAGGNQMMSVLASTLTFSVAGAIATTYTDGNGTGSKTNSWITSASGMLINRVVGNTTQASATVQPNTPFMPLTNAGTPGVTELQQVVISGGTITAGTINHKIVRPLVLMPFIAANSYIEQDTTLNIGNMVELRNVSQVCGCIGWSAFSAGTTAVAMSAFMRTVEG